MTDEVFLNARVIRENLETVKRELETRALVSKSKTEKELLEKHYMKAVQEGIDMLMKLSTEVQRLRLGIGHYQYGRIEMHQLRRMAETWNQETWK